MKLTRYLIIESGRFNRVYTNGSRQILRSKAEK